MKRNYAKKGIILGICAAVTMGICGVMNAASVDEDTILKKSEKTERVKGGLDVSDIVEEAMASVVSIDTKTIKEVQSYYSRYGFGFGMYSGSNQQVVEGSGSGIVIGKNNDELLIVTNNHVVEGANTVTITFADGQSYSASEKGYDEERDLAVVSVPIADIDASTLDAIQIATIGDSDALKVGEQVVAIGNALGYGQSVTTGIVSAKNRSLDNGDSSEDAVNLIQTDAAINPGNSGGALLNMNGEVIGINSAKMSSTSVEGIGYAIAISDVSDVIVKLMNEVPRTEKIEDGHGTLGISGRTISDEMSGYYNIPKGVYITGVTEDGPADEAGITKGFIITAFDGKKITTLDKLTELLEYYAPGEEVEIEGKYQDDGEYVETTVTVVLGESDYSSYRPRNDGWFNNNQQYGNAVSY